jgi:hypothetical protein
MPSGVFKRGLSSIERHTEYTSSPNSSGCTLWSGPTIKGYGYLRVNKKIVYAHRFSYQQYVGPIPKGMLVCHRCDVPLCQNPKHLFLGTIQQNNLDKYIKGRVSRLIGEKNPNAKITNDIAKRICLLYNSKKYTQKHIGKLFCINDRQVSKIVNGKAWVK